MKLKLSYLLFTIVWSALQFSPCYAQNELSKTLSLNWRTAPAYDGKDNLSLILVLRNNSNDIIKLKEWDLFFNSMFPVLNSKTAHYDIEDLRGNFFKISFHQNLAANDSLVVNYTSQYPIPGISTVPNGFYLLNRLDKKTTVALNRVDYQPIKRSIQSNIEFLENLYDRNKKYNKSTQDILIFPTPKYIKQLSGKFSLEKSYQLTGNVEYLELVEEQLAGVLKIGSDVHNNSGKIILTKTSSIKNESYNLKIDKNNLLIEFGDEAGLFYALKSIRSLHKGLEHKTYLPCLYVKDEPRYTYRGFMMDIARNFRTKEMVLKYLDIMAENKLNVFHFHFIDDEAWRIDIPGIPELIEVGAGRSPLYMNGESLLPAYGSGANTNKQYLTRQDFIEILRYANKRHIQVVPEIETPGHSRAAIRAMEYRYHKYKKEGNSAEAEKYLLHDLADQSEYNTAQNFGDNVLNPALPSVYRFLDKVLTEFKGMYEEAEVPFVKVSLGGDEVPPGVWEKSPQIAKLMKSENLSTVNDVWTYYINKINTLCISKGLQLAGWEEIGMVNKGKGMVANPDMPNKQNMQLDVWNNMIGAGQDDLVYKLANAGFPTVLISASNTYFDMMWDTSFDEPGLKWATYADLYHSYSLLPEDYFANIHTYYSGKKLDKSYINGLVRLTEKGRSNFLGIKGGVFAETLLEDKNLDYLAFPRFYVLVERAWAQRKDYESEATFSTSKFDQDYSRFMNRIAKVELPSIYDRVSYRLPRVALKQVKGKVFGNTEYPSFAMYYTLDGTNPTPKSAVLNSKTGINVKAGQKLRVAVIDESGRSGIVSSLDIE